MIPDIKKLSAQFFVDYPTANYPEIEQDPMRPYILLVFPLNNQVYLCTPFRTHMNHKNGYSFVSSQRSITNKSGIDYSKTLIITNMGYLDGNQIVDNDEYNEMVTRITSIKQNLIKYVNDYIDHHKNVNQMHPKKYNRLYRYTTLKYFHDLLGI